MFIKTFCGALYTENETNCSISETFVNSRKIWGFLQNLTLLGGKIIIRKKTFINSGTFCGVTLLFECIISHWMSFKAYLISKAFNLIDDISATKFVILTALGTSDNKQNK